MKIKRNRHVTRFESPDGRVMRVTTTRAHVFVHLNWYGYRPYGDETRSFMELLEETIEDGDTRQILDTGNREGCVSLDIVIDTFGKRYGTAEVLAILSHVFENQREGEPW